MTTPSPLRVVLDTDTFNEVDDQFALAYLCLSPDRLRLEAVHAAPFTNARSSGPADGMEKSYREIHRVLALLGGAAGIRVCRGATAYIGAAGRPVESEAVRDLIARALDDTRPGPLHVLGIAAATNLASAILLAPEIIPRVRLVWLGGHPLAWPTAHEFNLQQDVRAAQILFECGVPLTLVPCKNVAEHLRTTIPELRGRLASGNGLCAFLQRRFAEFLTLRNLRSKPLWDVVAGALLVNPGWVPVETVPSPRLTDDERWESAPPPRHAIAVATGINRDAIFADLCRKLAAAP
ncbi:MAG: nucleoside hydrolase [Opitutaceae bacterium]|jgi:inosine-uridine nucleoside N-ribohydrolase|nr:nucleoside hydrolase [Opitutaceae bacterium]